MDKKSVLLSVVVPVYNEQLNVAVLREKLVQVLSSEHFDYELIFVNDGSTDNSFEVIRGLARLDTRIKFINLSRNFGQQAALTAGMDYSKGDLVITMDCDLQDPPELIPEMIAEWKRGALVVFTRRRLRKEGYWKVLTAKLFYAVMRRYSDLKITGNIADFRLVDRKVLDKLNNMREKSRYLRGMVAWLGFNYAIVEFDRPERVRGNSGYDNFKMARLAMDGVVSFSSLPLRLGLVIGLICIFSGMGFLLYITGDSILNHVVYPLYKWLVIALFILIGFLFILIWFVAEYIRRIYDESKGRPIYVVQETENI
jgi:glycosyltransferase involved in cell wall biosynthesis